MPAADRVMAFCDLRRANGFTPAWDATYTRDDVITDGGRRRVMGFRAERAALAQLIEMVRRESGADRPTQAEILRALDRAGAFLVAEVYRRQGLATNGNVRSRQLTIIAEMETRAASVPVGVSVLDLLAEARDRIQLDTVNGLLNAGAVVCHLIDRVEAL